MAGDDDNNDAGNVRHAISASAMNAIPTFSGDQSTPEAALTFLELMTSMQATNTWPEGMALHVAQSRLRGPAAAWYRNLKFLDDRGAPTTFKEGAVSFVTRFRKRFIPPKDIWAILKRNDRLQQKHDENIGVYLDRIHACSAELAAAIFPDNNQADDSFRQAICTTAVLASFNGVCAEVKTKFHDIVQARPPVESLNWADYSDLMQEAGLVQQRAGAQMPAGYNSVASTSPDPTTTPQGAGALPVQDWADQEVGVDMAQELENFQVAVVNAQASKTVVCWHCRKRGHISKDCRAKQQPRVKWTNSNHSQTPRRQNGQGRGGRGRQQGYQRQQNRSAAVDTTEEVNGPLADMWANISLPAGNE